MKFDEVFILEDRGLLYINGEDAKNFLQNIVTNDVNKVSEKSSCFSALLTPQGKYLYDFIISQHKSGFFLDCEKENIEDYSDNTTRFITIGLQDVSISGKDKTSIIVTTKNESGSLYRILKPINDNGINLTHITYRPSRVDKWNYSFFLDLEGHKDEKNVKSLLEQLKQASLEIKVLGSYPKAQI